MNERFSYQFFSTTHEAWDAMYQAILDAQESVYWDVYMFFDDEQGQKFVDLLCDKASMGVDVKIILDAVGSMEFSSKSERKLKLAGAEVLWYNPIFKGGIFKRWFKHLWKRDHRKILVVDGKVGFVGGVNVRVTHRDWNDLHLRVTGRAARSLRYGFAKMYVQCGGKKENMHPIFHPHLSRIKKLSERLRIIMHSPDYQSRRRLLGVFYKALDIAKESITLVTPYYAPDTDFVRMLERAAKRGVRIDLIMPARSDMEFMELIAQKYFNRMIKMGINIYVSDQMNHAKAVTIDDKVGMVGSINLTHRSFHDNEEAGAIFNDKNMVRELNDIISGWKKSARPVKEEKFVRNWWQKIKARIVDKIEHYV
ncbi:MAG: phosphatidylserine/phosphatidylglycerophosphate/cardiolipin synthase family protein [Candidatus Magasanikbacteria bacterium]